jgi:uncharacterized membrane protein
MASSLSGGSHDRRGQAVIFLRRLLWTVGAALVLILLFGTALGAKDTVLQFGALVLFWLGLLAIIAVLDTE